MKTEIDKVTVSLERDEAFEIINAISKGIGSFMPEDHKTMGKAVQFSHMLRAIFQSQVTGVHIPKGQPK